MNYILIISNIITACCLIALCGMGIYFILESQFDISGKIRRYRSRNYTGPCLTQKDIKLLRDLNSIPLGSAKLTLEQEGILAKGIKHLSRDSLRRGDHLPDHNPADSGISDKDFHKLKSLYL